MAELAPTRSAALALADERQVIRQGYDFLDEKRMLLAAEMVRALARYRDLGDEWNRTAAIAAEHLGRAIAGHGLDGVESWPPLRRDEARIVRDETPFLGVTLLSATCEAPRFALAFPAIGHAAEIEAARGSFADLVAIGVELAAMAASLERLIEDYKKTERRARALENVLLPDINAALKRIVEHLEMVEQEEAIRVRKAADRQGR
ncbi:MAG TPA: V-type ATP synthase subunit D [Hyphomicrobiales bacterium]|nr:V-type ATP synthase subunit D [Hyphomicrobiales bacterium]